MGIVSDTAGCVKWSDLILSHMSVAALYSGESLVFRELATSMFRSDFAKVSWP